MHHICSCGSAWAVCEDGGDTHRDGVVLRAARSTRGCKHVTHFGLPLAILRVVYGLGVHGGETACWHIDRRGIYVRVADEERIARKELYREKGDGGEG